MTEHPFAPFMREAVKLAENGRWLTAPNPCVGAVLVREGTIVASGWHKGFGKAHAEQDCLDDAAAKGIDPADCTLVVTLEPCNHQGQTPPCSEAILAAGIRHVVIGVLDPNPQAMGGAKRLEYAGVKVEVGVLEQECRDLIADFMVWQTTDRPYLILKLAATLDGHIATRGGQAQRISNDASQARVMAMRAGIGKAGGAVLVGGNTLIMDDPALTARLPDVERQPLAAVAVSRLPGMDTPLKIVQERPTDCVFFCSAAQAASPTAQSLRARNVKIYGLDKHQHVKGLNVRDLLRILREEQNCHYVLCEGGARLGLSLLEAGVVDEFHLHIAPFLLGDDEAKPMLSGRSVDNINDSFQMRLISCENVAGDVHLVYRPAS